MKKYIGKKQVEAEPMTKGEAYESGLLSVYVVLNTKQKGEMGYHIKYEDGYESWSPAEVFQRAYIVAESPLDRMKIEHDELIDRYNKLNSFIGGDKYKSLDEIHKELITDLLHTMIAYLGILNDRIGIMEYYE